MSKNFHGFEGIFFPCLSLFYFMEKFKICEFRKKLRNEELIFELFDDFLQMLQKVDLCKNT